MKPQRLLGVTAPQAEKWFRVLCGVLAVEHFGLACFGWWVRGFIPPPEDMGFKPSLETGGTVLLWMGLAFGFLNLALIFAPRKPWVWVAGLSNLAATVVCCPPGLLVLIAWNRLETKRHFGMPE